jgi:hypothetical protein
MVLPIFGLVAGFLFFAGSKWYEKDLGKVKSIVLLEE